MAWSQLGSDPPSRGGEAGSASARLMAPGSSRRGSLRWLLWMCALCAGLPGGRGLNTAFVSTSQAFLDAFVDPNMDGGWGAMEVAVARGFVGPPPARAPPRGSQHRVMLCTLSCMGRSSTAAVQPGSRPARRWGLCDLAPAPETPRPHPRPPAPQPPARPRLPAEVVLVNDIVMSTSQWNYTAEQPCRLPANKTVRSEPWFYMLDFSYLQVGVWGGGAVGAGPPPQRALQRVPAGACPQPQLPARSRAGRQLHPSSQAGGGLARGVACAAAGRQPWAARRPAGRGGDTPRPAGHPGWLVGGQPCATRAFAVLTELRALVAAQVQDGRRRDGGVQGHGGGQCQIRLGAEHRPL